jgi:hypothetical protein
MFENMALKEIFGRKRDETTEEGGGGVERTVKRAFMICNGKGHRMKSLCKHRGSGGIAATHSQPGTRRWWWPTPPRSCLFNPGKKGTYFTKG